MIGRDARERPAPLSSLPSVYTTCVLFTLGAVNLLPSS
jgi:hypothetical protein